MSETLQPVRDGNDGMRCRTTDGNERCCLIDSHPGQHMGRWYTMEQAEIDRFEQYLSTLSIDERRQVYGYVPSKQRADLANSDKADGLTQASLGDDRLCRGVIP